MGTEGKAVLPALDLRGSFVVVASSAAMRLEFFFGCLDVKRVFRVCVCESVSLSKERCVDRVTGRGIDCISRPAAGSSAQRLGSAASSRCDLSLSTFDLSDN